MPEDVYRIVLPLVWTGLLVGIVIQRRQVRRRIGREPVVLRPWRRAETPAAWLERTLGICALVLTLDIALNALWPDVVAQNLAVPALRTSGAVGALGLVLVGAGLLLASICVQQMGVSWRIGIDTEAPGALVSRGLYARVRHPIYSGMLLGVTGIACTTADLLALGVAAAAWIGLPLQARLEEQFLLARHGDEYAHYLARTGRFWPGGSR